MVTNGQLTCANVIVGGWCLALMGFALTLAFLNDPEEMLMSLRRLTGRLRRIAVWPFRFGAHAVSAERSFAVQRASGLWVVLVNTFGGLYLFTGGANHLRANVWWPLVNLAHTVTGVPAEHAYRVIGAVLLTGGVLGILGLKFETKDGRRHWPRMLTSASCVISTAWYAYAAVLFGWEDIAPPPDDDNFVGVLALAFAVINALRFQLLYERPNPLLQDVLHL